MYVPTNYVATMSGFKMPATISANYDSSKGTLAFSGQQGSKILVKLANQSGAGCPAYLPVELTDYTEKAVATPWIFEWPVGKELTPRIGLAAGPDARAMSERVDDNLPGYIYEPESRGRNWNPRLYHRPDGEPLVPVDTTVSVEDLMDDVTGESEDDPFEDLESAIYGVNESASKIQVWWRANFQTPQMSVPVTYPALVQNYKVTWKEAMSPGLFPEITLSSQLGSADPLMTAWGARSLMLLETNATASVDLGNQRLLTSASSASVGFACYVSPDAMEDGEMVATPGRIAKWTFGDRATGVAAEIDAMLVKDETEGYGVKVVKKAGAEETFETQAVPTGTWFEVEVALPAAALGHGVTATYGAADAAAGDSATFIALDSLGLWYDGGTNASDVVYGFDFASDDDLATLGTNQIFRGLAYIISGGQPVLNMQLSLRSVFQTEIVRGVRLNMIYLLILAVIFSVILTRRRAGVYIYAIGSNVNASRMSGINVEKYLMVAYIMCSVGAAMAGMVTLARLGTGEPTAGDGFETMAIAAAAIGGTSLAGGKGAIPGTILGAFTISALKIGLVVIGMDTFYQFIAIGLIIIFATYMDTLQGIVTSALSRKKHQ